uniref:EF-hand domain-containing protein n=2 Tax=Manihot esculenta TaxID=3983 RepID=A0A2C9WLM4_MANES
MNLFYDNKATIDISYNLVQHDHTKHVEPTEEDKIAFSLFCFSNRKRKMENSHVLVLPFPAQGHVNPLMHFAWRIANLGSKVTFVNTDFNHKRVLSAMAGRNEPTGSDVNLVSIPDGMDPEDDRTDIGKLCEAMLITMRKKFQDLIEDINKNHPFTCIIVDGTMGWAREVADKLGIRVAMFWPASAAIFCQLANISNLNRDGYIDSDGFAIKKHKIQISPSGPIFDSDNLAWKVGNAYSQKAFFKYIERVMEDSQLIEWQLCNSIHELEAEVFSLVPKLLPIGPLLAGYDTGNSGAQFWPEDSSCLKWLDRQPSQSVIYVAFGSLTIFDQSQLQELALGLKLTNKPFLWVVRPGNSTQESNPNEFEDSHGKIISWAPQQKVLSHPAIACFVSHCGWNSAIEGVSNGVPFLCWPYFTDQFVNKSYICDVWKIGLGLDKDEKGIITKEEFKQKVELLLGDKITIKKALELKQFAEDNIREGGQSSTNFSNFIKWVEA